MVAIVKKRVYLKSCMHILYCTMYVECTIPKLVWFIRKRAIIPQIIIFNNTTKTRSKTSTRRVESIAQLASSNRVKGLTWLPDKEGAAEAIVLLGGGEDLILVVLGGELVAQVGPGDPRDPRHRHTTALHPQVLTARPKLHLKHPQWHKLTCHPSIESGTDPHQGSKSNPDPQQIKILNPKPYQGDKSISPQLERPILKEIL